ICPWIAEGKLPNLAALMKTGAWGRLASILPPFTPPAWTAFMTGKNPGKHGIFHFLEARPGTYELTYLNGASRRAKTIWRMLSDAGYTVGTTNIPFTYPPEHLNGFQISGMDTPSEKSPFVYPPELHSELVNLLGRFQLDLRYLGYMTTDPRREQVLVVSDHGGGPTSDRVVYLNRYLAQLGLLHYRKDERSALNKLTQKVIRSSYTLLRSTLSSRQKSFLARTLPGLRKSFESAFTSFNQIDWTRTKAYCSEVLALPPGIWINLKGVKPRGIVEQSEYEPLLKLIS